MLIPATPAVAPALAAPATPTVAPALAVLHAAAFPRGQAWGADAIAVTLGLPGAFGHWREGVGLVLARVAADEAEILTLAVVPGRRRQGWGGRLLAAAAGQAAAAGARALFLEVAADNGPARALYAAAGFTPVGRRPGYYADGGDAIVLRRDLAG